MAKEMLFDCKQSEKLSPRPTVSHQVLYMGNNEGEKVVLERLRLPQWSCHAVDGNDYYSV